VALAKNPTPNREREKKTGMRFLPKIREKKGGSAGKKLPFLMKSKGGKRGDGNP